MEAERKKYDLKDLQESYPDAPVEVLQDHLRKCSSWKEFKEDLHRRKEAWGKYYQGLHCQGLQKVFAEFLTEKYRHIINDLDYSRRKPDTLSRNDPGKHKTQHELEAEGKSLPSPFGENLDPERYAHRKRRELLVDEFKKESPRVPKEDLRAEIEAIDYWLEGKLEHPTVWNIAVIDEFPSIFLKLRKKNLTPNSPQAPQSDSGLKTDKDPDQEPLICSGRKGGEFSDPTHEQKLLPVNYFHSTGDHWKIRFNGEKGTVAKKKPFLFLLKYLAKPNVFLRSDAIFREVQSDLGKSAQRFSREVYKDDGSEVAEIDRESSLNIVMETALTKDETSVLTQDQKNSYEEDAKELIDKIELTKRNKDIEKAEDSERTLGRVIEQLKKEFNATMDPSTGKIVHYNRLAKGRNQPAEETVRNLKRAVNHFKSTKNEGLINLAEHIENFLLKDKNIYQPPKDFPSWDIIY